MIKKIVHSESAFKNVELQKLKIEVQNISYMDQKGSPMFCVFVVSGGSSVQGGGGGGGYRDIFNHQQISQMVIDKISGENGLKMKLLGLCHSNYEYVKKWSIFMNREKIECLVDFNVANY